MRKRPNIHWIDNIYTVSNKCSYCNKPIFPWEEVWVYLDIKKTTCENCIDIDPEWSWDNHIYHIDPEYNKYYSISDKRKFEKFIWEKVKD